MSTTTAPPGVPARNAPPAGGDPPAGLAAPGALARLFAPIRPHLIGCGILSALSAASGIVPYVAAAEIARLLLAGPAGGSGPAAAVWTWVAAGAAGAGLWLLLLVQSSRLGHFADAAILHDLRVRIVRHLGALPLGWFRTFGSGRVKRAMTGDLEEMHEVIAHALGHLTGAITVMVVAAGYLFVVDVPMALVVLGVLALMGVCYRISMRSMTTHVDRLVAAEGRISAASVEYADGIAVVKAFGTGGRVLHRFDAAVDEYAEAFAVWVSEVRYSSAATRLFGSELAILTAVTAAGLAFVAHGTLGVADLVAFLVVSVGLPTSVLPAVSAAQGVRKGRMAAADVERLLSLAPLPEPGHPGRPAGHDVELDQVRQRVVMLRTPDGRNGLELAQFERPAALRPEPADPPANTLGLRRVMFAVDDIDDTVDRLRARGGELVGEIVQYEEAYRLCYLRGPEHIVIGLAEPLG